MRGRLRTAWWRGPAVPPAVIEAESDTTAARAIESVVPLEGEVRVVEAPPLGDLGEIVGVATGLLDDARLA